MLKKFGTEDGYVNLEAFQMLLENNGVLLSKQSYMKLKTMVGMRKCQGNNSELIEYSNALRVIQPNMAVDEPLQKEWVLQTQ